jgi:hypothetical protein
MAEKNRTISVPPHLYDLLNSVAMHAAVDVGRRLVTHQIITAALMVARDHHPEFQAYVTNPPTPDEITAMAVIGRRTP